MSSTQTADAPGVDQSSPEEVELRKTKARRIVRNHALATAAIGLIPLPGLDLLAMIGIQVNMLKKLQEHYGQVFAGKSRIYSLLWGLLSGAALPVLLFPVLFSLLKVIPIVGTAAGMIAMPLTSGPVAYAVGRTFMQHFESGGTLLTFNPAQMRQVLKRFHSKGQAGGTAGASAAAPASAPSAPTQATTVSP